MLTTEKIIYLAAAVGLLWLFRETVVEKLQTKLAMVILGFGGVGFYLGYAGIIPADPMSLLPSLPF